MKLILLWCLILFSGSCLALTDTFLKMKPNRPYMNFVLPQYLNWHAKNFPSNFERMNQESAGLVKLLVLQIDHWLVPGLPEQNQISIGFRVDEKNTIYQTFRLYIHQQLKNHPFIQKARLPSHLVPRFLQWKDDGEVCLLGSFPSEARILYYFCRRPGSKNFIPGVREEFSRQLTTTWKNPFPFFTSWEIRTLDQEKIISITYSSDVTHPSLTPRGLDPVINSHGVDALFPFDKYSLDAAGNMTVYYP